MCVCVCARARARVTFYQFFIGLKKSFVNSMIGYKLYLLYNKVAKNILYQDVRNKVNRSGY